MHVLICSHFFHPSVGGLQTNVERLARYLSMQNVHTTVVTRTPDPSGRQHGYEVVREFSLRSLWCRMREADIIHLAGFSTGAGLLALWSGRPVVRDHYDYDTICPKGIAWYQDRPREFSPVTCTRCLREDFTRSQVAALFARFLLRRLGVPFVQAHVVHNRFQARRLGLPRDKTTVILYGVETSAPEGNSHSSGAAPVLAVPSLLFVGRLIPEKGAHVLLEAFSQLRRHGVEVDLTVCGDGPERERLQRQSHELEIAPFIHFLGNQDRVGVQRALDGATIVVVPSLWDDNAPIASIEAMRAGKAVVATNGGGLAEMVGGNGFLFPRGDATALAGILETLCRDEGNVRRIGSLAAQHAARGHDWRTMGSQYLGLYAHLLRGGSRIAPGDAR